MDMVVLDPGDSRNLTTDALYLEIIYNDEELL